MTATLPFIRGLESTDAHPIRIPVADVEAFVQQTDDLYELTFADSQPCRAHLDIDGKMSPGTSEEDFDATHSMILLALSTLDFGTPFSLCTSSKYNNKNGNPERHGEYSHKLSYSLIFLKKAGSKEAVKLWTREVIAPQIQEVLADVFPFYIKEAGKKKPEYDYIDYDESVYSSKRKMRCVFTSKPRETRPKLIHSEHGILDTLITYVPADCEMLPEPPRNEVVTPVVEQPSVTLIDNAISTLGATFNQFDTLQRAVMALRATRADDRADWIRIGMALKHAGQPVEAWVEFSKQSPKYRYGECERLWRGFEARTLTERTIWAMLKQDNPDVFKELCYSRRDLERAFEKGVTHLGMAQHFVSCRPDQYMYDGEGWWYMARNQTWVFSGSKFPPTLCITITRVLEPEIEEYRASIRAKIAREEDGKDDRKSSWNQTMMKNALDCQKSLYQNGFLKSTAELCAGLYAEQTSIVLEKHQKRSVRELMDSNPMLFAFQDAVYDFTAKDGKAIGKRPIEPTDYIVTTCGYDYPTPNPAVRQHMEEVLKGIWSKQGEYGDNGETYEYVMRILATSLCGVRWMEAFFILTGSGRNGKGLLFELLQAVMGNYYYQLPVQVLTTKIDNPRAANPDIANLVGKRMVCSTEPEANEKLLEGTIKAMTGGDPLTGRALYGNPNTFKPQFWLGIQCNVIPLFNGITRGGALRNKVIPFPFEFKDDPQTNREKLGDPIIKNVLCKSAEWRDEMFHLLLDRFEHVRGKAADAIPMSALVRERTDEYVAENNLIGLWWQEHYEPADGEYVLSKDAYLEFKADTGSHISDKQFKAGMAFNLIDIKKIGKRGPLKDKMGIAGWKRKEHENVPGSDDEKEEAPMFRM